MAHDQTGGLPRAILHIDGDGFFAGCEVALNPRLRGKPVIVGQERGIALSYSPEAKALGITRAMPITQVKRLFPQVIVVPSDYETYSLFSKRMFAIVRRYTSAVEEYSIDECFAEITGLEQTLRGTYTQIAERIKNDLKTELGMTFSVGVSSTKVLSKLASRWNKPDGLTVITNQLREHYLTCAPVKHLWGIGPQTTKLLERHNVLTANDLAQRDEAWVHEVLTKVGEDIWRELHGEVVFELTTENKDDYQSIQKVRTFSPPSTDREYIFAQLSKNIENACIKLRRHKLHARTGYFFLKTQDMRYRGTAVSLPRYTMIPATFITAIRPLFKKLWQPGIRYRATGIVLSGLSKQSIGQLDLFGESALEEKLIMVYKGIDTLDHRHGKHTVFLGSSLAALNHDQRGIYADRKRNLFRGENFRKRVGIPLFGEVG